MQHLATFFVLYRAAFLQNKNTGFEGGIPRIWKRFEQMGLHYIRNNVYLIQLFKSSYPYFCKYMVSQFCYLELEAPPSSILEYFHTRCYYPNRWRCRPRPGVIHRCSLWWLSAHYDTSQRQGKQWCRCYSEVDEDNLFIKKGSQYRTADCSFRTTYSCNNVT